MTRTFDEVARAVLDRMHALAGVPEPDYSAPPKQIDGDTAVRVLAEYGLPPTPVHGWVFDLARESLRCVVDAVVQGQEPERVIAAHLVQALLTGIEWGRDGR